MTWALIARADDGGLGNQTAELARHVRPDRVLVVNPGGRRSRGTMRLERFDVEDRAVFDGDVLDNDTVGWLLDGVDTVFTVECWYSPHLVRAARRAGVRTIVQANPELLVDAVDSDLIVLPTPWEAHRTPQAKLLPVPVALDRFVAPERSGRPMRTLYHPAAPAMLDRNGTDLLLTALRYVRTPLRVLIRGAERPVPNVGAATVEWLRPVDHYWDAYPPEADLMVLPRRYGGLSLSMQEAAAVGLPTVALDLEPQRRWLDPAGLVEATVERAAVPMRGGRFDVWACDPRALARRLDQLADHSEVVDRMRDGARAWAAGLDWRTWTDAYRRVLTRSATGRP